MIFRDFSIKPLKLFKLSSPKHCTIPEQEQFYFEKLYKAQIYRRASLEKADSWHNFAKVQNEHISNLFYRHF